MSILRKLMKLLGIKTKAQKAREREINYRMKLKKLNKQAQDLERNAENSRMKAYNHEMNGEHEKAVIAASHAANSANVARTVANEVLKYEEAHDKAESMQIIRDSYELMNEAAEIVTDMADIPGFEKAKTKNEEMQLRMQQTNDQLDLINEGLDLDTQDTIRNEAGEAALKDIMAAYGETAKPAENKVRTAAEESREAWARSRREELRDMVAEA